MPKSPSALTTMWGCAILGGRRGEGGRSSEESEKGGCFTVPRKIEKGGSSQSSVSPIWVAGELTRSSSRNSRWDLRFGERRCGFNTKHQSTINSRIFCEPDYTLAGVSSAPGNGRYWRVLQALKFCAEKQGFPAGCVPVSAYGGR